MYQFILLFYLRQGLFHLIFQKLKTILNLIYFMSIGVLLAYMSVYHMHAVS